jgi:Ca-activated chloride channel family protein
MKTTQRILAPFLILAAILITSPVLAKPLVGCDLSLDRTILPAGLSQKTVIKVNLDVPVIPVEFARPPVNLTLVLDRSGSMSGSKIEKA